MNIYRKNYRRYDMEEIFITPETKLAMALRINSEIVAALASVELMEENIEIITTLLHKHSSFVLEVSQKAVQAERLDVKIVK
jgi:hypothetical protein